MYNVPTDGKALGAYSIKFSIIIQQLEGSNSKSIFFHIDTWECTWQTQEIETLLGSFVFIIELTSTMI